MAKWSLRNLGTFDIVFASVLLLRLVLQFAKNGLTWGGQFGSVFNYSFNPFARLVKLNEFTFWQVLQAMPLLLTLLSLALLILNRKKIAAWLAIVMMVATTVVPALAITSLFYFHLGVDDYVNPWKAFADQLFWNLELDGKSWTSDSGKFNFVLLILQHLYTSIGLIFAIGFCIFYLTRQNTKRHKAQSYSVIESKEVKTMNKASFCSKCGSGAGEGDYCSICGNSLLTSPSTANSTAQTTSSFPRISPLAITALIISLFISWVGLILGYMARKEIRRSNGQLTGEGLATAAIVIGWIWTVIGIFIGIAWGIALGNSISNNY